MTIIKYTKIGEENHSIDVDLREHRLRGGPVEFQADLVRRVAESQRDQVGYEEHGQVALLPGEASASPAVEPARQGR